MFREMRRKRQQLTPEETEAVLARRSNGTLAVLGDDGYPYAVPLSYVWHKGRVYFHCAKSGHKLDAIRACDKVCFTVVDLDDVIPEKFTTAFRSAVVFGRARIVTDEAELIGAMRALAGKYSPNESEEAFQHEMKSSAAALCVVAIDVEHMTGKQGKELLAKP